ncbi:MAG TPA: phosphatidylglycerophosphatase A [Candidatus Acidoferrum sp.]|nr:phosphatidylglycerophosphatase A [Candidatus Acidoferrum sp.]
MTTQKTDATGEPQAASSVVGASSARERKPRFALFVATAAGLGRLPKAPGTWGSLAGVALAVLPWWTLIALGVVSPDKSLISVNGRDPFLWAQIYIAALVAGLGVWSSQCASEHWGQKDPQKVVIDEVSGQHLTLFLGCVFMVHGVNKAAFWDFRVLGLVSAYSPLNWKYLVAGFILFRVFDIWKPFPARQAESLPGGWGIMADDWIAGIYAAIVLMILRGFGF